MQFGGFFLYVLYNTIPSLGSVKLNIIRLKFARNLHHQEGRRALSISSDKAFFVLFFWGGNYL